MVDTKNMTLEEKHEVIDNLCDKHHKNVGSCIGCVMECEPDAWCKRGFISMVSEDEANSILQKYWYQELHTLNLR